MILKLYAVVMALIFALFTYFQMNDPDGLIWIGVYGLPCLLFVLGVFSISSSKTALASSIGYGVGFVLLAASVGEWIMDNEAAREAGGVALTSLCLLGFWYFLPRFKTWMGSESVRS